MRQNKMLPASSRHDYFARLHDFFSYRANEDILCA